MEGKILPHIISKLKELSRNLDIDVVTSSLDGIAEVMARGGSSYRFVVNLKERTCSCRAWDVSGIPCKHAIAYITSIPGEKIEDHVDNYYSVQSFRAAYEGTIPSIPDKSMWPKKEHAPCSAELISTTYQPWNSIFLSQQISHSRLISQKNSLPNRPMVSSCIVHC
jgi:hypothetical protein